jgi:hypothetical protein
MLPEQLQPPNLSAIQPEAVPDPTALVDAQKEVDFFAQDKKSREHVREQNIKDVIHRVLVNIILVSGVLLGLAVGVRVLHMILPECWNWLSEKQINTLDNLAKYAGSGALGVTLTKYLSRNIGE